MYIILKTKSEISKNWKHKLLRYMLVITRNAQKPGVSKKTKQKKSIYTICTQIQTSLALHHEHNFT